MVRLSFGETSIGLWAILKLPFYHAKDGQLFPYRTLAMLSNLLTTLIVSILAEQLHRLGMIPSSQNVCISRRQREIFKQRRRAQKLQVGYFRRHFHRQ